MLKAFFSPQHTSDFPLPSFWREGFWRELSPYALKGIHYMELLFLCATGSYVPSLGKVKNFIQTIFCRASLMEPVEKAVSQGIIDMFNSSGQR